MSGLMSRLRRLSALETQEALAPDQPVMVLDQEQLQASTSQDMRLSHLKRNLLSFLGSASDLANNAVGMPTFLVRAVMELGRNTIASIDDDFLEQFMYSFASSILTWIDEDVKERAPQDTGVPPDGEPGSDSNQPARESDVLRPDGDGQEHSEGAPDGTLAPDAEESPSPDPGQQAEVPGGVGVERDEGAEAVPEVATGDSDTGVGETAV